MLNIFTIKLRFLRNWLWKFKEFKLTCTNYLVYYCQSVADNILSFASIPANNYIPMFSLF